MRNERAYPLLYELFNIFVTRQTLNVWYTSGHMNYIQKHQKTIVATIIVILLIIAAILLGKHHTSIQTTSSSTTPTVTSSTTPLPTSSTSVPKASSDTPAHPVASGPSIALTASAQEDMSTTNNPHRGKLAIFFTVTSGPKDVYLGSICAPVKSTISNFGIVFDITNDGSLINLGNLNGANCILMNATNQKTAAGNYLIKANSTETFEFTVITNFATAGSYKLRIDKIGLNTIDSATGAKVFDLTTQDKTTLATAPLVLQ